MLLIIKKKGGGGELKLSIVKANVDSSGSVYTDKPCITFMAQHKENYIYYFSLTFIQKISNNYKYTISPSELANINIETLKGITIDINL